MISSNKHSLKSLFSLSLFFLLLIILSQRNHHNTLLSSGVGGSYSFCSWAKNSLPPPSLFSLSFLSSRVLEWFNRSPASRPPANLTSPKAPNCTRSTVASPTSSTSACALVCTFKNRPVSVFHSIVVHGSCATIRPLPTATSGPRVSWVYGMRVSGCPLSLDGLEGLYV